MSITLDIIRHYSVPRESPSTPQHWRWLRLVDGAWVTNASKPSQDTPTQCSVHKIWFDVRCLVCSGIVLREFAVERERKNFNGLEYGQRGARSSKRSRALLEMDDT